MPNLKNLRRGHLPGATLKPQVKLPKDPGACWEWLGAICPKTGYGQKQWHGRKYLAHRWLWMQLFGPIPDHLPLNNTCGNKACPSPHHWRLSTSADVRRNSICTVLSSGDVVEIKRIPKDQRATRLQRSMAARHYAEKFGCSKQLIYDIWAGRAWRRVDGAANHPGRPTMPHPEEAMTE